MSAFNKFLRGAGEALIGVGAELGVDYIREQTQSGGGGSLSSIVPQACRLIGATSRQTSINGYTVDVTYKGQKVTLSVIESSDRVSVQTPTIEMPSREVPSALPAYLLFRSRSIVGGGWEVTEQGANVSFDCSANVMNRGLTAEELAKTLVQLAAEYLEATSRSF